MSNPCDLRPSNTGIRLIYSVKIIPLLTIK